MIPRQKRLHEVFEYLRNNCGIHTQTDFANAIKYSRVYVSSALNGNENNLTDKLFESVYRKFPQFNIDYLLKGEGQLLVQEPETAPVEKQQDALTYAAIQVGKMMAELSNSIASVREFQKKLEETEERLKQQSNTLNERIAQLDKMMATLARQDHRIPGLEPIDMAAEPLKKRAK